MSRSEFLINKCLKWILGCSLWLDKVCIDQSAMTDDLRCLPVFLAGCNGMLVTSGTTYRWSAS